MCFCWPTPMFLKQGRPKKKRGFGWQGVFGPGGGSRFRAGAEHMTFPIFRKRIGRKAEPGAREGDRET